MSYYRGADACAIVFDVTDRRSFNDLDSWYEVFTSVLPPDKIESFPIFILGNKADLDNHEVTIEQAKKWCKNKNGI